MATSKIEWTNFTWNPVTGCSKISAGCKYCYAETMAKRLQAMGLPKYAHGFQVTLHPDALDIPYNLKSPKMIFVNSMSDLFHENVPNVFIEKIFGVIQALPQHVFQVLTKRPCRLQDFQTYPWPKNLWLGVTVEDQFTTHRIDQLRQTNARMKFVSFEPLLANVSNDLDLRGIDWVIVGGESGRHPRPMEQGWVLSIKEQCEKLNIPFYFKQWGGKNKGQAGRLLQGKIYDAMPPH
jgi:protein gp37